MTRRTIGIIFGGRSEEHPVSLKSAGEVDRALDRDAYDPVWIGITPEGAWRLCEGPALDGATAPAVLSPDPADHGLLVLRDGGYETIRLDAVLPVLHGRGGEDGTLQGLLELSGIPYAGCDLPASALAMDKALAYLVAGAAGIATPSFRIVHAGDAVDPGGLAYPVFVKPARSGSSFGVTTVTSDEGLAAAIAEAAAYDAKVLIEDAVPGLEIGCAILGTGADLVAGDLDRVALSSGFFRIHQEAAPETGSENSAFIVPADIPADARDRVLEAAKTVYRALGCRGLARVDMFLLEDGSVVLNEVNTLPGLTSYSRYPRMMASAGMSLGDVLDRVIGLALR
jgi:D-alanine--(R)-lactate ligase